MMLSSSKTKMHKKRQRYASRLCHVPECMFCSACKILVYIYVYCLQTLQRLVDVGVVGGRVSEGKNPLFCGITKYLGYYREEEQLPTTLLMTMMIKLF